MPVTNRRFLAPLLATGLLALAAAAPVRAQIFKCTDGDGNVAFRQTPCPDAQATSEQLSARSTGDSESGGDCGLANRFAYATARYMHSGMSSSDVFARYGGVDALSKSTLGVINFVYGFESIGDVGAERIASLSEARCRSGSLGELSCETLPPSYARLTPACNPDLDEAPTGQAAAVPDAGPEVTAAATPAETRASTADTASDPDRVRQCREPIEQQIEAIDTRMRAGYSSAQGEAYRERLRDLTQRLRECARNP